MFVVNEAGNSLKRCILGSKPKSNRIVLSTIWKEDDRNKDFIWDFDGLSGMTMTALGHVRRRNVAMVFGAMRGQKDETRALTQGKHSNIT